MSLSPHNPMVLAEMTRAVQSDQPDADWHELEPILRAQWQQVPRAIDWDVARATAASHFRMLRGLPDAAPVVGPGPLGARAAAP